jgi:hypothetical protein
VRLKDARDPHRLLSGGFEIGLDVKLWIHHSAASFARSAEQVASAAGLWRQEVSKNHRDLLSRSSPCHTPGCAIGSNTIFGT